MPTLLLRLAGPMQSWGTTSRFDNRDTGKEPSKSGVIGLLAAAMGIDRENRTDLEPLTLLVMGVRHDRPRIPKYDYQTAQHITSADGKDKDKSAVTRRDYIADGVFLVGLESEDKALLSRLQAALLNPVWPLCLGRKSYVPSETVWVENGLQSGALKEVLCKWPWLSSLRKWEKAPDKILISLESRDGSGILKMDQPLFTFAERRFGARYVCSEWLPFPAEVPNVPA